MTQQPSTLAPAPPGPAGILRAADIASAQHDPLAFLLNISREYGDLARYQTPYGTTYLANSPELISHVFRSDNFPRGSLLTLVLGHGLLASDGPWWKKQRSLMLPAFHPRAIARFIETINAITREHLGGFREYSERGEPIDLAAQWLHLTLHVVGEALFSGDLHDRRETFYEAVKLLLADVGAIVCSEFLSSAVLSPERNRRVFQTIACIDEIVYAAIAARRKCDEKDDLLSLLLAARDENGEGLSDREIRDEIVTMVFAGNETTATALGWSSFVFATQPEIAAQVQAEADRVLDGRAATLSDIERLPFLQMFFDEALRVYPPVWSIFRKVKNTQILGGFQVEAGHTLVVSPYAMHHHPKFWPEPERFDPSRFSPENVAARPRHAYIPFGGGRHVCIGQRFAIMEAMLVLAQLAQCFDLEIAPQARIEAEPLVTLRFKHGLPVVLRERSSAAKVLGS